MKKAKLLIAMMLIGCLTSCNDGSNLNSTDSQDKGSISESSQSEVASSEASSSTQSEESSQGEATSSNSQNEESSQEDTSDATVSDTEWQEIFDGFTTTNATCTRVVGTSTMSLKVESATKVHAITNDTQNDQSYAENILYKDGNNYYIYARASTEDKYTRTSVDETSFTARINSFAGPVLQINQMFESYELKGMYENFDFDDAQGAYVATISYAPMPNISTTVDLVVKFADKNLTYVSVTTPQASSDGSSGTMEYSDFGTTTVTIPTDFNENSGSDTSNKITEAEWQKIFTSFSANNFCLHATILGSTLDVKQENETRIFAKSEGGMSDLDNSNEDYQEIILDQDGEHFYQYLRHSSEESYVKSELEQQAFEEKFEFLQSLCDVIERLNLAENYQAFTFNGDSCSGTVEMMLDVDFYVPFNIVINFADKSLVHLTANGIDDGEGIQYELEVNTAAVQIPSIN